MNHKTIQTSFFVLLFLGIGILMFFLFRPFISAIIAAFTLAVLFHPLYKRILKLVKGKRSIAAFIGILIVLIVVMVPLLAFGWQIFQEGRDFYFEYLVTSEPLSIIPDQISSLLGPRFTEFQSNLGEYLQQGLIWVLEHIGVVFSNLARLAFLLFITLIALYYFFKEGSDFKKRVISFSPLSDNYDKQIMDKLQLAVSSVIRGVLVVAIVQAILSGIGFAIFGIPNPVLWGSIAMISALIPGFGTALVMIPAVLYLLFTGNFGQAVGLAIWAGVFVGLVDNFLSPILVSRGIKIHNFFVLLSVLGGLALFGPIGFLTGPLILSLFFALLDIYPTLLLHEKKKTDMLIE